MPHDRWRFRHEIRSRHADVLEVLSPGVQEHRFKHAADHPQWYKLGLGESRAHAVADKQDVQDATNALTSLRLSSVVAAADDKQTDAESERLDEEADLIYNDYNQYYVDSGLKVLPGTWVQNVSPETRFVEYVSHMAHTDIQNYTAIPPTYHKTDLKHWVYRSLPPELTGMAYDVIMLDPPLASYKWDEPSLPNAPTWSWDEIAALPIPQLASHDSFVFLWVGSGNNDGLERGREVLQRWGYRRCEDIVWIRTSKEGDEAESTTSLLRNSVQHCLMGIRGTVVRSTDSFFVHCNIDTDVILWPGETIEPGVDIISPLKKPLELYTIAENFCLGTRRLELFGTNRNLRRGWLTVGTELGPEFPDWSPDPRYPPEVLSALYPTRFGFDPPGCELHFRTNILPFSQLCEDLRPKTPPNVARRAKTMGQSGADTGLATPYSAHLEGASATTLSPHSIPHIPPPMSQAGFIPSPLPGNLGPMPAGNEYTGSMFMSPVYEASPNGTYPIPHGTGYPVDYGAMYAPSYSMSMHMFPNVPYGTPSVDTHPYHPVDGSMYASGWTTMPGPPQPYMAPFYGTPVNIPRRFFQRQPPRSALLGQGAGGRETVSIRSESERFSGAQVQVLQQSRKTVGNEGI
ncbi:mRNA (2'-O-methyladenosine-N(6)-)-methyltransferase [Malassezia brasiliensis]|uniref:mRNA (2'-O-methyladenosine-N(6)-)-methyltransferase n=1 Tax=Malassezia brasiliensis TaxID=1821822 RepID=A0AAF0DUB2_9BASI|nr:mRNA (2'-O-methyladenosine-N(6)-)-methyltransferase [Malassezia brasiliensis]